MSNYKRDKNKQFLDKKRLLIISFCLVACIALIAVAFVTVLKIDIQSL
jgi:hypothetical protein